MIALLQRASLLMKFLNQAMIVTNMCNAPKLRTDSQQAQPTYAAALEFE